MGHCSMAHLQAWPANSSCSLSSAHRPAGPSASRGAVAEHKVLVSEALRHKVEGVGAKLALLATLLDLLARSGIPDQLFELGLPLRLEVPVLCYALRLLSPAGTNPSAHSDHETAVPSYVHSASAGPAWANVQ